MAETVFIIYKFYFLGGGFVLNTANEKRTYDIIENELDSAEFGLKEINSRLLNLLFNVYSKRKDENALNHLTNEILLLNDNLSKLVIDTTMVTATK